MSNVLSKECRKCGGDLFSEYDTDGFTLICIQCSTVNEELTSLLRKRLHNRLMSKNIWQKQPELVGKL